jgi:hypothetical protein
MSDFVIVVVGAVERNPVIHVRRLIVVIVRVVVILPYVLLGVHVVLVKVPVHVNVSETILQLGVVVVRNGSEGIEEIGVDLASLGHDVPLLLLLLSLAVLHVGLHHVQVETEDAWVGQQVEPVAHATERAQRVGFETHK